MTKCKIIVSGRRCEGIEKRNQRIGYIIISEGGRECTWMMGCRRQLLQQSKFRLRFRIQHYFMCKLKNSNTWFAEYISFSIYLCGPCTNCMRIVLNLMINVYTTYATQTFEREIYTNSSSYYFIFHKHLTLDSIIFSTRRQKQSWNAKIYW